MNKTSFLMVLLKHSCDIKNKYVRSDIYSVGAIWYFHLTGTSANRF